MTGPSRLLRILTLRCEGASALASRELDEPLGLVDRLALRGHLLICISCRRFRRQILILRAAHRLDGRAGLDDPGPPRVALSPVARARIEDAILRALRDDRGGTGEDGSS